MPCTCTETTIYLACAFGASFTPTIAVITEGKALKSTDTTIRTSFRSGNCRDHTTSVLHTFPIYIVQYPSALVAVATTSSSFFLVLLIQPVTARSGFLLHTYTGQAQDTSCPFSIHIFEWLSKYRGTKIYCCHLSQQQTMTAVLKTLQWWGEPAAKWKIKCLARKGIEDFALYNIQQTKSAISFYSPVSHAATQLL